MRKIYVIICLLFISFIANAQFTSGFNTSFLILKLNGGGNTYYDLKAVTANIDFDGANLGIFPVNSNNLILAGAEHNVYKCGGCDITATNLQYYIHAIYTGPPPPPVYIPYPIGFTGTNGNGCGGQDQQWAFPIQGDKN